MYIDFSKLFHRASKDHSDRGTHIIPRDREWPKEWTTTFYKTYERLKTLILPKASQDSPLFSLIAKRESKRKFGGVALTLGEISQILKYSCGELETFFETGRARRAQPSGGGRFAIEAYVLIFKNTEDLPSGIYHYNVHGHGLDVLWQRDFSGEDIGRLFTYEWIRGASAAIVLTGVFNRSKMKYGQRGYRYILLEAGHIGQNVYLTSQSLGIGCCGMGGTRDEALEELLQIDGENESVVYSLILGK